ncbi:MAG: hypothetical protein B7Z15_03045 [Rhizobiales bacterium 32-66-8]|nr:MAG: hypothetical protein B7Z15_03045 [Rhizobiales bacterium 32-66-8]
MRIALANGAVTGRLLAAALAAVFTLSVTTADAKPRKQQTSQTKSKKTSTPRNVASATASESTSGWQTGTAAIIVDANTGKVLYEQDADELRHPASVTKVMTLYLLFEQLEAGRLRLDSEMVVSSRAASQSPSKLNVKAGQTIDVEDAIKALVTRSANDVAVVIAEAVGGDEATFAGMMTRKARALGMSRTTFRNANGLPHPQQVTTARDLATLGMAIQDRFPRQYKYFATKTFYYRGEAIGNHNRLLGRVEGVDGIKTGYTRASGFNLLTSMKRDGRYVIGVVLGGSSGASRDARMASLIANNYNRAYAGARTTPQVTETAALSAPPPIPAAAPAREARGPVAPLPAPQHLAYAADPVTTASVNQRAAPAGTAEPIKPLGVKTVAIQRPTTQYLEAPGFTQSVSVAPTYAPAGSLVPPGKLADTQTLQAAPQPQTLAQPIRTASAGPVALPASALVPLSAPVAAPARAAAVAPTAAPARQDPAPSRVPASSSVQHKAGWQIQIGAFSAEKEARAKLDVAQAKAKQILGNADPFTEKVTKGGSDLYRARFAGLDEKNAKEACRLLQRNDFSCMTLRN